ncbi:MAG: helix-turn-helix transcriptional regulator [Lawsonibacter sp.]|jgi:DNA-binding XRE family transcriptional regulator
MNISAIKIETMLAERGMTRTDLAELCGISRQNISTVIRRGTCAPKTAGKLAAGFGVPISDILPEVGT